MKVNLKRSLGEVENDLRLARLSDIRSRVRANAMAGRDTFAGLTSHEVSEYNGAVMFGDNHEAFPDAAEWSRMVD